MKALRTLLFLGIVLASGLAQALIGPWIVPYDHLVTRGGYDFYSSSSNYLTDGTIQDLHLGSQLTQFTMNRFWLDGEYGIARHWSALLHLSYVTDQIGSAYGIGPAYYTGSGIPQVRSAVKWNLITGHTPLTVELNTKIPFTSPNPTQINQLLIGDGNVDIGLVVHGGHHVGRLKVSLSPGLLVRFGGFSSQLTLNSALQLDLTYIYLTGYFDLIYSMGTTTLYDSSYYSHDAPGTGGTYALLSGSPVGFSAGGKLGIRILKSLALETHLTHAIAGARYPNYLEVGANLIASFDFFVPEHKTKVREIPLDEDQTAPQAQR